MTESLIVTDNLLDKNVENSSSYEYADSDLEKVGNFAQGSDKNFSSNNIDKLNDTLVFEVVNPTSNRLNVNLFGYTNSLFSSPATINPPPSVLQPTLFPVGIAPDDAEFCPANNFVYTADPTSNTIEVIDTISSTVVASIPAPAGFFPIAIAYNPVNNQMYVGSFALTQVIRVDCATNTIVGVPIITIASVNRKGISYNSVNNSMYVTVGAIGQVQEINCVTNLVVSTFIPAGAAATFNIAFNPSLNRAYITDPVLNNVYVIDCTTNLTVISVPIGLVTATSIVFCSSNSSVYVVGFASNNVRPINTLTNIPGPIIAIGANNPIAIAYNFINNILYVAKSTTNNFVTINPITNVVTGAFALAMTSPSDVVYNGNANSVAFIANGAGVGEYQVFAPLFPPSVVVTLSGGYTLGDMYNDLQGKPLFLKGLKMIVETLNQFFNNITVNYYTIFGKQNAVQFQPTNYISPINAQSLVIDANDFEAEIDGNTDITFDVEPLSSLIILFTINRSVDNIVPLYKDITQDWGSGTDITTNTRMTGNPVADIVLKQEADKVLSEPGYYSVVQYAFYPNLTGNPVADIALLNSSGFEQDH